VGDLDFYELVASGDGPAVVAHGERELRGDGWRVW
jgi:hypothetical protein